MAKEEGEVVYWNIAVHTETPPGRSCVRSLSSIFTFKLDVSSCKEGEEEETVMEFSNRSSKVDFKS